MSGQFQTLVMWYLWYFQFPLCLIFCVVDTISCYEAMIRTGLLLLTALIRPSLTVAPITDPDYWLVLHASHADWMLNKPNLSRLDHADNRSWSFQSLGPSLGVYHSMSTNVFHVQMFDVSLFGPHLSGESLCTGLKSRIGWNERVIWDEQRAK